MKYCEFFVLRYVTGLFSLSRKRFYCLTVTDIILNNPVSFKLQLHCPYLRVQKQLFCQS